MRIARWPASIRFRAAALAATVLVAAGIVMLTTGGSPAMRVIQAEVPHSGTVQLRVTGGRGELVLDHFPPPPAGCIYLVWYRRGGGAPRPTRIRFSVTSAGRAHVGLTDLNAISSVWVTAEPRDGRFAATTGPVIVVKLN